MQPVMRKGWSSIINSEDFINKSRELGKIPISKNIFFEFNKQTKQ